MRWLNNFSSEMVSLQAYGSDLGWFAKILVVFHFDLHIVGVDLSKVLKVVSLISDIYLCISL